MVRDDRPEVGVKLHHLGIPCGSIAAAREQLLAQWPGLKAGPEVFDAAQDATLCLLADPKGGLAYELVTGAAVTGVLKKGLALYHLCYEVKDLDAEMARLQREGYRSIREPLPAPLFNGRRAAFMHGLLGMVELLEEA